MPGIYMKNSQQIVPNSIAVKEANKKKGTFFSGRTTKRGGELLGWTTKEKKLFEAF